ncbi:hypothetical protein D1007_20184 [Hordeum vulgare]|nr:hypothetical protein D1007_20184 [Hordeum vulgare]
MVEEPSAKRRRGDTSNQNTEGDDVQVPGHKLDYTKHLSEEEKLCTFIGFSTEGDKLMLKESSLEINPNKYVDMQRKWRVPFVGGKRSHSLGVVADSVIHPLYKHMKYKINSEEDHKLWGISLLPDYLIEYGAIDAYATYESWKRIKNMAEGLECSKEKEAEAKEDNDYGYYYGGF